MKFALLFVLVVAFAVVSESDAAWVRRAWRRVKPRVARWASDWVGRKVNGWISGKRGLKDIAELDENLDGFLDKAELEKIMSTRDAHAFLETAAGDGNSAVTTEQFEELFRNLREMEEEQQ